MPNIPFSRHLLFVEVIRLTRQATPWKEFSSHHFAVNFFSLFLFRSFSELKDFILVRVLRLLMCAVIGPRHRQNCSEEQGIHFVFVISQDLKKNKKSVIRSLKGLRSYFTILGVIVLIDKGIYINVVYTSREAIFSITARTCVGSLGECSNIDEGIGDIS